MTVFETPGKENTKATLQIALHTALEREMPIVIASNTGETVQTLLRFAEEQGAAPKIVVVGQVCGFSAPGQSAMSEEMEQMLSEKGVRVVRAAHALSGAERSISRAFGGAYPVEIVAHTLRMLGQGVKVCVEMGLMAMDCGALAYGQPVVCVAGTGRGADTACVLTPSYTASLWQTQVHEILCKPY